MAAASRPSTASRSARRWRHRSICRRRYALNLGGNRKITLLADAFNLFNIRRALDYNAATEISFDVPNPDFGTVTSQNVAGQMYQNPFALRLGARFGW